MNSLNMVCLQRSGKWSPHHSCSQAVIPGPAAASFTPHVATPQEIQPIHTSHSKVKSWSSLISTTSYAILSILPMEKNVHEVSVSPWKGFPGDAGGARWGHIIPQSHDPTIQAEWPVGKGPWMGTRWNGPMSPPLSPSPAWRKLMDFSASAPQCISQRKVLSLLFLCRLII